MPSFKARRTRRNTPRPLILACVLACAALSFASCDMMDSDTARVWTDRFEVASAAELFNASQNDFRIEVEYRADPARALAKESKLPDIVIGPSLDSARDRFQILDYFFSDLKLDPGAFYDKLLATGNLDGHQVLLPLSFNLPAVIFASDSGIPGGDAIMEPATMLQLSKAFNRAEKGVYERIGYSPRWEPEFLYLVARLYGTDFADKGTLTWNEKNLNSSLGFIRSWVGANGSALAEDEFHFKYLYTPGYVSIAAQHILFWQVSSKEFFLLPEERKKQLDFKWLAKDKLIPANDDMVFIGLPKGGSSKKASEAFVSWLLSEDGQKKLLEKTFTEGSDDRSFGICGGFSCIRKVTEEIFPKFYPRLVGHQPPADYIRAASRLPANWQTMKQKLILPFLKAAAGGTSEDDEGPSDLSAQFELWIKQNQAE